MSDFFCVIAGSYVFEDLCWKTCKREKNSNCIIHRWKEAFQKSMSTEDQTSLRTAEVDESASM